MPADRLPQIPATQFVEKWQMHGPDYFDNLGYSVAAVRARAAKLRKQGVPLKSWPAATHTRGLNIAELTAIAEKALSDSAESLDTTEGDSDV